MNRRVSENVGVAHGARGEDVAVRFMRCAGYEIVERDAHPVDADRRLDIDIVAYDALTETLVFVEVKQHGARSPYQRRLRSVDRDKRDRLRRACNAWKRKNKWRGGFRFDVIQVYGAPGRRPEIDHIPNVELFPRRERFVKWSL